MERLWMLDEVMRFKFFLLAFWSDEKIFARRTKNRSDFLRQSKSSTNELVPEHVLSRTFDRPSAVQSSNRVDDEKRKPL